MMWECVQMIWVVRLVVIFMRYARMCVSENHGNQDRARIVVGELYASWFCRCICFISQPRPSVQVRRNWTCPVN